MKLCPKCQKQFSDDANFCPVDAARLHPIEAQAQGPDPLTARFELGPRLGGGRTGAVHRATDKQAGGAAVAIKLVAPAVMALPGVAQRLERELKQLERVQSSGVARVLASGKRGDETWIATELVEGGQTLAQAITARGPIPLEQAAHLIEVVGEALIEAAQVGVVHRDLAPKNVMFAGQDIKLINFCLPVPTSDKVPGVPEFVAPEQVEGKPVDQRSNLYSLGALYYYVLTGHPVHAGSVDEVHRAHVGAAIRTPSSLAPVPAPVEALIMRALDKSPTKRFLTVRQFVDEVTRVARGEFDPKATQAMGKIGRPKAELVQTLLGFRTDLPSAGTPAAPVAIPVIAVPAEAPAMPAPVAVASPSAVAAAGAERSPWAPPGPVAIDPAEAPTPLAVAPVPVPPVVAAPVVAAPVVAGKKKGEDGKEGKGRFRETMWFKKGELDAKAADAAAEERARTGKDVASDKADSLPIEDRYKDDGSLSRGDKEKYSLKTGATEMMPTIKDLGASQSIARVSEDALIDEMKGGRGKVIALILVGVALIGALIVWIAL